MARTGSNCEWALGWPCCTDCGRTDRKHRASGRCVTCYSKHKYRTDDRYKTRKLLGVYKHQVKNGLNRNLPKEVVCSHVVEKLVETEFVPGLMVRGIVEDARAGQVRLRLATGSFWVGLHECRTLDGKPLVNADFSTTTYEHEGPAREPRSYATQQPDQEGDPRG